MEYYLNICKISFWASEISEHRFKFSTKTRYYRVPVIFFISICIFSNFWIFMTTFETFIGSETKQNGTIFLPRLGKNWALGKSFYPFVSFRCFHSVTKSFNKSRKNADTYNLFKRNTKCASASLLALIFSTKITLKMFTTTWCCCWCLWWQAAWPEYRIIESYWQQFFYKSSPNIWWQMGLFWKM